MKIPVIDTEKAVALKRAIESGEVEDNSPEFDRRYAEVLTYREATPKEEEFIKAKGKEILTTLIEQHSNLSS